MEVFSIQTPTQSLGDNQPNQHGELQHVFFKYDLKKNRSETFLEVDAIKNTTSPTYCIFPIVG